MKAKTEFLLSGHAQSLKRFLFLLVLVFLPTQLGRHFFISESYVFGLRIDYLSPTFYITDILVFILFILFIPQVISSARRVLHSFPPYFLIGSGFLIFSLLYHVVINPSFLLLYATVKFLELTFFAGVGLWYFSGKFDNRLVIFALSCGMLFESVLVIFQFLYQSSLGGFFYVFGERTFNQSTPGIANASLNGSLILRPYGTLPHPNVLGGYLLVCILFVWFLLKQTMYSTRFRIIFFSILIVSCLSLFLSLSRGAISLFLVFLLFEIYKFISLGTQRFKKEKVILICSIVFLLVALLLPRFQTLVHSSDSVTQRMALLGSSVEIVTQNPFFGVGPMGFLKELQKYSETSSPVLLLQPVHNIFVLLLTEVGIIGSIGATLIGCFIVVRSMQKGVYNRLPLFLLITILILGSIDHYFLTLQQGQLLLCFAVGYLLAKEKTAV